MLVRIDRMGFHLDGMNWLANEKILRNRLAGSSGAREKK